MNERIQEIMNQARAQYRNQNLPHEQGLIAYSEKFAELIVKECITLGTNFTNRNYSDDAGERIAKHFGVEE